MGFDWILLTPGKVGPVFVTLVHLIPDVLPLVPYEDVFLYTLDVQEELEAATRLTHVDGQDVEIVLRNNHLEECTFH